MRKNIFHNDKIISKDTEIKKKTFTKKTNKKIVVDINLILNRVKIDKKDEIKKKLIFTSSTLFLVGLMGTFLLFVK